MASVESAKSKKMKLFNDSLKRFVDFKCKDPQPRAFQVSKILGDKFETDKIYSPCMTVLHRCNKSGCCQPGYFCKANTAKKVQLVFRMEKEKAHRKKGISYVMVTAKNHTSCFCTSTGNTPKWRSFIVQLCHGDVLYVCIQEGFLVILVDRWVKNRFHAENFTFFHVLVVIHVYL